MNKIELNYSPYIMKLKTPFETSKGKISERKGFIITLKSESGKTGIGDAAPFPEFGSESYEEAEEALNKIDLKINVDINDIRKSVIYTYKDFQAFPSLKHGLEQALLNLICNEQKISLAELLNLKMKKEVKVNAAIGFLSPEDAVKKAKEFTKAGFDTLKLKTGRENFDDDLRTIKSVRSAVGSDVKIRIDANGKWNLDSATRNLQQLEELNIEYAEQPVNSIEDFSELKKIVSIPLAADESIRNYISAKNFISTKAIDVIVLKPMLIGGLIQALEIIELAESSNVVPVVTSSFESAVGRMNAVIAAASVLQDVAHGLAVSQYYEADIGREIFPINSGKITI
ncbi:MAG: o-succinylbenzoate synthase [Ignavibacteria bacterium]|nr:o-succinylbenzoate synthase [Ignavibacteria bacterium]MBT8383729.1 o-succinylbenzoate synthase [Ignavibacteria bacterium]MBT8391904.1 o-succinylbenzoate synthase [Ignavibacteria bacterium]NNJ53312.1 o-succinylbenzoate synthase [Ignavibacteriaceae bacterium]NNL22250.1 o-succinylbenzoate synthase [Ignavibacteriaceae bacterium]